MGYGKDGRYTYRDILGYNAKYNFVFSQRGLGKTFQAKLGLLNSEGTSMCLYRQQPDMQQAMGSWIDDPIKAGWDKESFNWEGSDKTGWVLEVNGKPKIWFRALTMVNHIKQESFPDDMNWVWMDEFIPLAYRKLAGIASEGDAIRAIVKTIDHDTVYSRESKGLKPLRVIMTANPFTWNNPILSYFHIIPRGYGIWRVGPDIVAEMVEPIKNESDGKMTVDEFLGDEVNVNQGWLEAGHFVSPLPKGAVPVYAFRLGDGHFTRWKSGRRVWITTSKPADVPKEITTFGTWDELKEYEEPITKSMGKALQREAYQGLLRYDDVNTKYDYLRCVTNL